MNIDNTNNMAIFMLTKKGFEKALYLFKIFENITIYAPLKFKDKNYNNTYIKFYSNSFKDQVFNVWKNHDSFLFIMATGIVVRCIKDLIEDKYKDPAVIVMDEMAKNTISLLSGHVGFANNITLQICNQINSNPIITTATDVNQVSSLDTLIVKLNQDPKKFKDLIKETNMSLAQKNIIDLKLDLNHIESIFSYFPLDNSDFMGFSFNNSSNILISNRFYADSKNAIIPKNLVLAIGCRKNISFETLHENLIEFLKKEDLSISSIESICSIDLKKNEPAILNLSRLLNIPFFTYSKDSLIAIESRFEGSEFVKKSIGVSCVVEPCIYLACEGNIITKKYKKNKSTFCIGIKNLKLNKRKD